MVSKILASTVYLITSFGGQGLIQKGVNADGAVLSVTESPLPAHLQQNKNLKVALLGDTGCRVRGKEIQDCTNPEAWPAHKITAAIANDKPDFVVHVGDYHYRESCKHPEKCAALIETVGYTWKAWKADWFEPAMALQEIPTIYVRGNHENCNRAWEHWQTYLSPDTPQEACRAQDKTQFVQLPGLLIVNGDLSWVNDDPSKPGSTQPAQLRAYLTELKKQIQSLKKSGVEVWVLFHQPAYGVVPYLVKKEGQEDQIVWASGTPRLTEALEATSFDEVVDLYVSGHVHNAQVSQNTTRPVQIVVGQSGTKLEPVGDYAKKPIEAKDGSRVFVPTAHNRQFGYMVLEMSRDEKRKTLIFKDTFGKPESRCDIDDRTATCENLKDL